LNNEDLKLTEKEREVIQAMKSIHNPSKSLEWFVRMLFEDILRDENTED
jgi:hypothetical protein